MQDHVLARSAEIFFIKGFFWRRRQKKSNILQLFSYIYSYKNFTVVNALQAFLDTTFHFLKQSLDTAPQANFFIFKHFLRRRQEK